MQRVIARPHRNDRGPARRRTHGSLDSKTSVQVMDLLRDVARDLVIMVTHGELAHQYTTRIRTGRRLHRRRFRTLYPYRAGPARRNPCATSMGFLTALSLSFNNLTRKAHADDLVWSIGIIGVCRDPGAANGTNAYRQDRGGDPGVYPLDDPEKSGLDMTAALAGASSSPRNPKGRPARSASQMRTFADSIRDAEFQTTWPRSRLSGQQRRRVPTRWLAVEADYDVSRDLPVGHLQVDRAQVNPDRR